MKKVLVVAVPAGLALVALALVLSSARTRAQAEGSFRERTRLKREFVERAALLRTLDPSTPAAWQAEVAALSRWYLGELDAVRARFPDAPPAPSALEAARGERDKDLPEKERDAILDFEEYTQGRFALLRDGKYAPVASAVDGGLRLDLLAVDPGNSPAGGPGLRIDFALWGAPRLRERDASGGAPVTRTGVAVALRTLALKMLDAKGAELGGMEGPGEPYQKVIDPERFVDDFPPGVLFGTWWVELLPREAVTLDLVVEADARGAAGASHPLRFTARQPVPEGWKIPPGASYEATVREVAPAKP